MNPLDPFEYSIDRVEDSFNLSENQLNYPAFFEESESMIDLHRKMQLEMLEESEGSFELTVESSRDLQSVNENQNSRVSRKFMHQNSSQSSTEGQKREKRIFNASKKRRRGIKKTKLQKSTQQYYTKNFLQFGKTPHFLFLQKQINQKFIQNNDVLRSIMEKKSPAMADYQHMYEIEELQEVWERFFASKYLYTYLMLSRTLPCYKLIYMSILHKYERAFREKKFRGVSRIEIEEDNETVDEEKKRDD